MLLVINNLLISIFTSGWLELWQACLNWFSKQEAYWLWKKTKNSVSQRKPTPLAPEGEHPVLINRGVVMNYMLLMRGSTLWKRLQMDLPKAPSHSDLVGKPNTVYFSMFLRFLKCIFYDNVRWKKKAEYPLSALMLLKEMRLRLWTLADMKFTMWNNTFSC